MKIFSEISLRRRIIRIFKTFKPFIAFKKCKEIWIKP